MGKHIHAQAVVAKTLAAIDIGQAELARRLKAAAPDDETKYLPALVYQWAQALRPIAPKWAIPFETVSGGAVTRHEVAPDVFGNAANDHG